MPATAACAEHRGALSRAPPELAEKVDALGAYCRFEAGVNERLRELSLLAMLLNTFQVDLKPGDEPPFPDVRGHARVPAADTEA